MSGPIEKSGWFRDAYRMKIGEGPAADLKAGLDTANLSALVAKARTKFGGDAFEFRLVQKRGDTYLEVLRQKTSTLRKDAKTDYFKEKNPPTVLLARDKSRLDAVRLIAELVPLRDNPEVSADQESAWKLGNLAKLRELGDAVAPTQLEGGHRHFAVETDRGEKAKLFFQAIDLELKELALERVNQADKPPAPKRPAVQDASNVAQAFPAAASQQALAGAQRPGPAVQPDVEQEDDGFSNLALGLGENAVDKTRWDPRFQALTQAQATTAELKQVHEQASQQLLQAQQRVPVQPQMDRLIMADGKMALRAKVGAGAPDRAQGIHYYDHDKLKRINGKGAYKEQPLDESKFKDLFNKAGLGASAIKSLNAQFHKAERRERQQAQADRTGAGLARLWGSRALPQAVLQEAAALAQVSNDRLASGERGLFNGKAHKETQLAPVAAQALLVDLVATEHLMAVSPDPQERQGLLQLHQKLGDKLLAYLGAVQPEPQTLEQLRAHLQASREAAGRWADARQLGRFILDVDQIKAKGDQQIQQQQEKARQRLDEAKKAQEALQNASSQVGQSRLLLMDAKANIAARAEVMSAQARQARAAGNKAALRGLQGPVHKTQVPPSSLSGSYEWQELCAYAEAVNQMGQQELPEAAIAANPQLGKEFDPVLATQIISTMRQLMESSIGSQNRPLQVYMPGFSNKGPWVQWVPQEVGGVQEKALLVALSQLMEIEFMMAYNVSASPAAAQQLKGLHGRVSQMVMDALDPAAAKQGGKAAGRSADLEQRTKQALEWVKGSSKRAEGLYKQALVQWNRPDDPISLATRDRATQLFDQMLEEEADQRLLRARNRVEAAQSELTKLGEVPGNMALGFLPDDAKQAIDQLLSADAGMRRAAAAYLTRELRSSDGLNGLEKTALAESLADQILKATPEQRAALPTDLRFLAAMSTEPKGQQLAQLEGPRLRQAMQSLRADLSKAEEAQPEKLFNRARLISQTEMKANMQRVADERQVAVKFLITEADAQAGDVSVLAQRFADLARNHFSDPEQTRPVVGMFLVNGLNHWVSLVAEKKTDGSLTCVAVDTDVSGQPTWMGEVQAELNKPAQQDKAGHGGPLGKPISMTAVTGSLQVNRLPNACGALQTQMVKALAERKADSPALDAVSGWMNKSAKMAQGGGQKQASDQDLSASWGVNVDRAQLLAAANDEGQTKIKEEQFQAERLRDLFIDRCADRFNQIGQLYLDAPNPGGADYEQQMKSIESQAGELLDQISKDISDYRVLLADLVLFGADGQPVDPTSGWTELAHARLNMAAHLIQLPAPRRAQGLDIWRDLQAQGERHPEMRENLEKFRLGLVQDSGVQLLEAGLLDTEQKRCTSLELEIGRSLQVHLRQLAQELLPGLPMVADAITPGDLRAYLDRYPQRTRNAAVLAQAAERLVRLHDDDLALQFAHQSQAYSIWQELASNPWCGPELQSQAEQAIARVKPQDEPLEVESSSNLGFELDAAQAEKLRSELESELARMLDAQGLERPPRAQPQAVSQVQPQAPSFEAGAVQIESVDDVNIYSQRADMRGALIESESKYPKLDSERIARIQTARTKEVRPVFNWVQEKDAAVQEDPHQKAGWAGRTWVTPPGEKPSVNPADKPQVKPVAKSPVKLADYCKARDRELTLSLFGSSQAQKGVLAGLFSSGGGRWKDFKKPPPLQSLNGQLESSPRTMWNLCELMLLQHLRDSKSSRATEFYQTYLEPTVKKIEAMKLPDGLPHDTLAYRQKQAALEIKKVFQEMGSGQEVPKFSR
jgi:hypothetical protein